MFRVLLSSLTVVLLVSSNFLIFQQAAALPVEQTKLTNEETKENHQEVNDLHNDYTKNQHEQHEVLETTTQLTIKLAKQPSLKYDVEILEKRPVQKENNDIEERFRGPALEMNTNTFYAENIEMNNDVDKETGFLGSLQRHEQLIVILALIGLTTVVLYAVLLLWRSYYHQRYGMRELLLATGNNYYEPNNNLNTQNPNHNLNSVYNTTTQNLVSPQ